MEKLYPCWISSVKYGNFEFHSLAEYEKWLSECTHPGNYTTRGCDGIYAWQKVVCDRCGKELSGKTTQVWGDAVA